MFDHRVRRGGVAVIRRGGLLRRWPIVSAAWIIAIDMVQWSQIRAAIDVLSFEIGARPTLDEGDRRVLARDCAAVRPGTGTNSAGYSMTT